MIDTITKLSAVVAGHICLDVIPDLDNLPFGKFSALFQPGHILNIGPTGFSTGGPVSNTGLALHRLGVSTQLIAKVGDDLFAQAVRSFLATFDPKLTSGLVIDQAVPTSYSVIISPPGVDRIFLHCPGANDAFLAADIETNSLSQVNLFHFGYPPLMRHMYRNDGAELVKVLQQAKQTGVTTSLDTAFPDPVSESGQANWRTILRAALPYVDIFLPSIEELLFLVRRPIYDELLAAAGSTKILQHITPDLLANLSDEMLDWGIKIMVIKLGDRGVYLRTADQAQLSNIGRACPQNLSEWSRRELWAPCFKVEVVGTTGSGDATIAGFLTGLLRDESPQQALTTAVAVGACNVEAADAISGVPSWQVLQTRLQSNWPRLKEGGPPLDWHWLDQPGLWTGPHDQKY